MRSLTLCQWGCESVSAGITDQQFHPAGLRVLAEKDALRARRVAFVVSPFGIGQVGDHGLRQARCRQQEEANFMLSEPYPSAEPAVLDKCDRKWRASSSPASKAAGGSPAKSRKSRIRCA